MDAHMLTPWPSSQVFVGACYIQFVGACYYLADLPEVSSWGARLRADGDGDRVHGAVGDAALHALHQLLHAARVLPDCLLRGQALTRASARRAPRCAPPPGAVFAQPTCCCPARGSPITASWFEQRRYLYVLVIHATKDANMRRHAPDPRSEG